MKSCMAQTLFMSLLFSDLKFLNPQQMLLILKSSPKQVCKLTLLYLKMWASPAIIWQSKKTKSLQDPWQHKCNQKFRALYHDQAVAQTKLDHIQDRMSKIKVHILNINRQNPQALLERWKNQLQSSQSSRTIWVLRLSTSALLITQE